MSILSNIHSNLVNIQQQAQSVVKLYPNYNSKLHRILGLQPATHCRNDFILRSLLRADENMLRKTAEGNQLFKNIILEDEAFDRSVDSNIEKAYISVQESMFELVRYYKEFIYLNPELAYNGKMVELLELALLTKGNVSDLSAYILKIMVDQGIIGIKKIVDKRIYYEVISDKEYQTQNQVLYNKNGYRQSFGEAYITNILLSNGFEIKHQMTFPGCKYIKPLRFDIYLPKEHIAIEYQGKQHYEYIPYFHGNDPINFELSQKRDKIKKDYGIDNGLPIIYIEHDTPNIKYTLQKEISEITGEEYIFL